MLMSEQSFDSIAEDEISLKSTVNFLAESWKVIIFMGFLGLVGSIAYLWVTPSQYQATAQILMAQVGTSNTTINPKGVDIEDPNLLMVRLRLPSAYSSQEIEACGFESPLASSEVLLNHVKFSTVKAVPSMIEIKVNRDSKEIAIACAQSVFENIKVSQFEIIKPYIEEAKNLLVKYQERLIYSQSLVARADKSGVALSAAYLANRDELKFLNEEIIRLNTFITTADARQTKLVSPIHVSGTPVFPKKTISLISGLMVGIVLGLIFALIQKALISYR